MNRHSFRLALTSEVDKKMEESFQLELNEFTEDFESTVESHVSLGKPKPKPRTAVLVDSPAVDETLGKARLQLQLQPQSIVYLVLFNRCGLAVRFGWCVQSLYVLFFGESHIISLSNCLTILGPLTPLTKQITTRVTCWAWCVGYRCGCGCGLDTGMGMVTDIRCRCRYRYMC